MLHSSSLKTLFVFINIILIILSSVEPALANPYFYVSGDSYAATGNYETYSVKLYTDTSTVTAAQAVINFDPVLLQAIQISNIDSICNLWGPADPSLGLGNLGSPYVSGGNKIVLACGFTGSGYHSAFGDGDLIATFTLNPLASGSATITITNQQFRYIGNTIVPDTAPDFSLEIFGSTVEAESARPTPRSTATPSATPTPAAASPDTLRASDILLVEVGTNTTNTSNSQSSSNLSGLNQNLDVVEENNLIPSPPAMDKRAKPTPRPPKSATSSSFFNEGEVLSLQSLRELLIPGKSVADRTLVIINLLMTIAFLVLLAILIWRLIVINRVNRLKLKHAGDIIEGEISAIQSKIEGVKKGTSNDPDELEQTLDELKQELIKKL